MKRVILILFIIAVFTVDLYFVKQLFFKTEGERTREGIKESKEGKSETIISPVKQVNQEKKLETPQSSGIKSQSEEKQEEIKKVKPIEIEKRETKKIVQKKNNTKVKPGYMIAKVFVNLRKKPDVNSERITVIRKGASVKVVGKKANHWKKVIYKHKNKVYEGWVDDRFFIKGESLKSP